MLGQFGSPHLIMTKFLEPIHSLEVTWCCLVSGTHPSPPSASVLTSQLRIMPETSLLAMQLECTHTHLLQSNFATHTYNDEDGSFMIPSLYTQVMRSVHFNFHAMHFPTKWHDLESNLWLSDVTAMWQTLICGSLMLLNSKSSLWLISLAWNRTSSLVQSHQTLWSRSGSKHQRSTQMMAQDETFQWTAGVISIALQVVSWGHCPVQHERQQFPVDSGCRLRAWLACPSPQWWRWSPLSQWTQCYQKKQRKISHLSQRTL